MRPDLLLDAGTNGGLFADIPNRLVGNRLFHTTMTGGAWKQIVFGFFPAPILA
jgi:hypothetical protein